MDWPSFLIAFLAGIVVGAAGLYGTVWWCVTHGGLRSPFKPWRGI